MSKLALVISAGTLAAALSATAALAGVNLVQNGNFATGDFSGWSVNQGGGYNSPAVVAGFGTTNHTFGEAIVPDSLTGGSPDSAAGYAAYFSTDYGTQTLSQQVTLGKGTYSIGFDAYILQNGYNNPYDATFSGSIGGTSLLASASINTLGATYGTKTWIPVYGVATIATPGTYTVDFSFTGSEVPAKDIAIDRVFVVAGDVVHAPEPASVALLGAGLIGLATFRRRRG